MGRKSGYRAGGFGVTEDARACIQNEAIAKVLLEHLTPRVAMERQYKRRTLSATDVYDR